MIAVLSGNALAAVSSSVMLPLLIAVEPPASLMKRNFCPPGPTNRKSTSSGVGAFKPLKLSVTFEMVPTKPLTTISDGYGLATVEFRTVKPSLLEKVLPD